jgi:hypothetical protein
MKVRIKSYPTWWGPYQLAELLSKVGVSEDTCHRIGEKLSNTKLRDICQGFYDFKVKHFKKDKIVIESWDTWSMDTSLAKIALPMLKQLRETTHGAPNDMPEFSQTSNCAQMTFKFYADGDDSAWAAGHARWMAILDSMIWSFEQILSEDWEAQFFTDKNFDKVGYEKHYAQIQTGLELFGKHYRSLWD